MRLHARHLSSIVITVIFCLAIQAIAASQSPDGRSFTRPSYPPTEVKPVIDILHGMSITDPYRWLEDQNSPQTREWITAQNRYSASVLDSAPLFKSIEKRLNVLSRRDTYSVPIYAGGRVFYSLQRSKEEQSSIYVCEGVGGPERKLVDTGQFSSDNTASVALQAVSLDGTLAAYSIRKGGDDRVEIRIIRVADGKDLPDRLPVNYNRGITFKPDNSGFYYARLIPLTGYRVYYHALTTDTAQDRVVFGEKYGPDVFTGTTISDNGRWLIYVAATGWTKSEAVVVDLTGKNPPVPLATGLAAMTDFGIAGDRIFAKTDLQSPKRRIVEIDMRHPEPEAWKTVIPGSDDSIESWAIVGGRILVQYLHNVSSVVRAYDLSGNRLYELALPGIGTAAVPVGFESAQHSFLQFESFTQPTINYYCDVSTGKLTPWPSAKMASGSSRLETKQVWVTSKDGTRVPMFLVQKKGLRWDSKRPTLLTGYGGFNSSWVPMFASPIVEWAESGGVVAMPNLRGGGEFGEQWHQAGMLDKKQNVFDDFHASAEWLIGNKVTDRDHLAIEGASNGGLLVGVAVTQRPELFRAVCCDIPLLDMVRYHQFLQGPQWVPEYGSADDPAQFKTLLAYSPYHHVKPGTNYPAVLFTTGDGDTRVAPLHARKMTALMQASTSSQRPILLHYDTLAGHSGGEPMTKTLHDAARRMAFLRWQIQISTATRSPDRAPGRTAPPP